MIRVLQEADIDRVAEIWLDRQSRKQHHFYSGAILGKVILD